MLSVIVLMLLCLSCTDKTEIPSYLIGYESIYRENPRAAALQWFQDARYGMFVHYALASLLPNGKDEFLELMGDDYKSTFDYLAPENNKVLAGLFGRFTAEKFDATFIANLAVEAGMKYVTFTTQHLGRMVMYETSVSTFSSMNAPVGRDLVAELALACRERGLGLFLYMPPDVSQTNGDFFELNRTKLTELLTHYGPIAGIWFDGIGPFKNNPQRYTRLDELHALVHSLQPQCLISFKEGGLGTEDFISPEHFCLGRPATWENPLHQQQWDMRLERWKRKSEAMWEKIFKYKPAEINTVMQECWNRDRVGARGGWINDERARHLAAEEVWYWLTKAREANANLLMNIGPRRDGSVHPDDVKALREVGRMIRENGFPGEGTTK